MEARQKEVDEVRKYQVYMVISVISYYFAPVLVSMVSIGVYQYLQETLNVADMLMGIALFQILQEPFRSIPFSLTCILETLTSMKRIEVRLFFI